MKTPEERRALKSSMPDTALGHHHTDQCRVLPNRGELLRRLPQDGVAAEIGAAFGEFTLEIFENNRPRQLHLIDAWSTARYQKGLEAIQERHAEKLAAKELVIAQGLSTDVLEQYDDHFFDWVYIDTDHSYRTTAQELALAARKVKPGGRIAGHDFCTGNVITPVPYGVVEACAEFVVTHGWRYEFITLESHGHFSFSLAKL